MSTDVSVMALIDGHVADVILSSPELKFTKVTLGADALRPKVMGQLITPSKIPNPRRLTRHGQALTPKICPSLRPTHPDVTIGSQNTRPIARTRRVPIEKTRRQMLFSSTVYQRFKFDPLSSERRPRSGKVRTGKVMSQMRDR